MAVCAFPNKRAFLPCFRRYVFTVADDNCGLLPIDSCRLWHTFVFGLNDIIPRRDLEKRSVALRVFWCFDIAPQGGSGNPKRLTYVLDSIRLVSIEFSRHL